VHGLRGTFWPREREAVFQSYLGIFLTACLNFIIYFSPIDSLSQGVDFYNKKFPINSKDYGWATVPLKTQSLAHKLLLVLAKSTKGYWKDKGVSYCHGQVQRDAFF
jgi:hypothetical protein